MSTVLSVQGTNFHGTIETKIGTIEYKYDDHGSCCEQFDAFMDVPLEYLVGKEIVKFDLIAPFKEYHDPRNYSENETYACKFIIYLEDGTTWDIVFVNSHNGYYSHEVEIIVDGKCKFRYSL